MSKQMFWFKRMIFKDDTYLLNTFPLVLVLLDFASLLHIQGINVDDLSLEQLAEQIGLDDFSPFASCFPIFQKKWTSRKVELGRLKKHQDEISEIRSEAGKVGAEARWDGHWIKMINEIAKPYLEYWKGSRGVRADEVDTINEFFSTKTNPKDYVDKFSAYLAGCNDSGKPAKSFYRWLSEKELGGTSAILPIKEKFIAKVKEHTSNFAEPIDEGPKSRYETDDYYNDKFSFIRKEERNLRSKHENNDDDDDDSFSDKQREKRDYRKIYASELNKRIG